MNQGNPPPYPGPGPTAPYPPYPSQPMGPGVYPPGPPGGPYPPPQGGYPYQGYPQYGWQGGPQEPPKTTGTVMWVGWVYSRPSVSVGSTPMNSANHQIENIWGKKFWKFTKSRTWVCCTLETTSITFMLYLQLFKQHLHCVGCYK